MGRFGVILLCILFINCANSSQQLDENNIILKYPVVLAHGIFAHDRQAAVDFWGRIPAVLRENGVIVFFGYTDAWGSYESNAELLKATIDTILFETKSEKVNIIAHSKGGIDSRYLIWKYDYGDKVASLTTIATPHHGAELADLIFQQKIIHSGTTKKVLKVIGELWGDINPDLYNVNYQLTTEKMKEFNEKIEMDTGTYYQSIYTTMRNSFDDLIFFYSYRYLYNMAGANDGTISESSAQWSDNITKFEGISHAEILDVKKRKISGIHIPDIYVQIVKDLGNRGF